MRRVSYGYQRLTGGHVSSKRRCVCACCLWRAGEPPTLAKRARCTTQVVVGAWRYEGLHWLEASLLRCAAVVRHASYGIQRQTGGRVSSERRRHTLAVLGEEAQHTGLLPARAAPRGLWVVHAP